MGNRSNRLKWWRSSPLRTTSSMSKYLPMSNFEKIKIERIANIKGPQWTTGAQPTSFIIMNTCQLTAHLPHIQSNRASSNPYCSRRRSTRSRPSNRWAGSSRKPLRKVQVHFTSKTTKAICNSSSEQLEAMPMCRIRWLIRTMIGNMPQREAIGKKRNSWLFRPLPEKQSKGSRSAINIDLRAFLACSNRQT